MTTTTVNTTDVKNTSDARDTLSQLNTGFGLGSEITEEQHSDSNYYYSAGSFNFILGKGFQPETLEDVSLTSVPFLPDWHAGIISIHGLIIPVIDILIFAKDQSIEVTESTREKTYLLKLEHKEYSPIVFKLDFLPRLVNTATYKKTHAEHNSPDWVKGYLKNESMTLTSIDHQKLFKQLISKQ